MEPAVARRIVTIAAATLLLGTAASLGDAPAPANARDTGSRPGGTVLSGAPPGPGAFAGPEGAAGRGAPPASATRADSASSPAVEGPADPPVEPEPRQAPDPAAHDPATAEPVEPYEPATPRKLPDPGAPGDAAAPAAPRDKAAPAVPGGAAGPAKPGDAAGPAEPRDAAEPAVPRDKAAPAEPADAAGPAKPGDAVAPAAKTAAERYGWGKPGPGSDEFDYTGAPDPKRWSQAGECWAGHDGNGGRCASRSRVDGSKLVQTGLANGNSAWIASRTEQRYGRWEARVRSKATGPDNGRQYHPLLIVWPSSDQWPQDGEYDFLENGAPGERCAESFIHYPHAPGPVQQVFTQEKSCGAPLSEWHNVAFEWTPEYVRGYIDGREWFRYSGGAKGGRRAIQDMPSGHLTIQLDNFFGGNMQPASYEVDWVRIYPLRPAAPNR